MEVLSYRLLFGYKGSKCTYNGIRMKKIPSELFKKYTKINKQDLTEKCLTYITMGTQPLINGPETIYPKLSINL